MTCLEDDMPLYETPGDRLIQRMIGDVLAREHVCQYVEWPPQAVLDCAFVNGRSQTVAVCEIKNRNISLLPGHPLSVEDVILDVAKYEAGVRTAADRGCPFLFIVRSIPDKIIYYYKHNDLDDFEVSTGGRTVQTRDEYDIDTVIHIKVGAFKPTGAYLSDDMITKLFWVEKEDPTPHLEGYNG
jgi:hypothetical protein